MTQGYTKGVPIDTDPTMALNSNQVVPSQAAVVSYVGVQVATKVASVTGTVNRITSTGGLNPVIDISAAYVGQSSITTLGTITTGVWNGTDISLADGGTNASLTASNGGIFYSTATAGAILAGTATAGQMLQSGASTAPAWSTTTYPSTNAINTLLYASSANVMSDLATANNSVVLTNATGVPSLGTSLINDFTYTSATAGAVRTLTVTNTDNSNTASRALIKAVSGGASAGDAVFQASTTTTTWSFGVDNSVTTPTADTFVISQGTALGTNNIMSVATSGEINYPLQPAFLVNQASSQSNVTGDGTGYTAVFTTEIFDQNNDYSSPTFTAPVTGRYFFEIIIEISNIPAGTSTMISTIITSNRNYSTFNFNPLNVRNGGLGLQWNNAIFADMDAADTSSVNLNGSGGTKTVTYSTNGTSYFGGYLVC